MAGNDSLLKGNIAGALVKFAIPVLLSNILQLLYAAVDLVVVGNFATTADMSAVAVSSQIMTTVMLGISGITTGLTVLLGQYSGAGSGEEVKKTIGSSIAFFALLSVGLTAVLLSFNGAIVAVMQTPPEAVDAAKKFLAISAFGTVFIVGYNMMGSIYRGLGDSKTPLIFVAIACAVNIVLDLVFVKGLSMGAAGAALATVIAQAGSVLFSLVYFWRTGVGIRFSRKDIKLHKYYIAKMLRIGAPISLQEILVNVSFLFITAVVNKMGIAASASVGTVEKIVSFLMMPTMAMSIAVATMSAHNYGAGQYARAKKCLWVGIYISLAAAAVICAFCWVRGTALTSLFSKDPEVVRGASLYLKTYALDCLGVSFVFNFNGYFSSCNKSVFAMVHSLLTTFLIRVPFVTIAGGITGVTLMTIGCAAPLSSLGSLILCIIYYNWLNRKMKDDTVLPTRCE